ncbi:MAG: biotin transporter BioY [Sphaerochaetaceae bacterium]|jgi:biotin transport system substrate-specific component|nr:biotin transporter BioY [Sphaerochaetaceae bacterium]
MKISKIVLIALFCALTIAGTFIRLPLPPVPITLQTFFVYLASLTLGPIYSFLAIALYLFLGLIGLPVFTSGGGLAALLGPTGGFLLAMPLACLASGAIAFLSKKKSAWYLDALALLLGTAIIYSGGLAWFMYKLPSYTLAKALAVTTLPFLIGDFIKIVLSVLLSQKLREPIQARLNA